MEIYEAAGVHVEAQVWASLLGASADPPEAYDLLEAHLGQRIDRTRIRENRTRRELEFLAKEDPLPGARSLIESSKEHGLLLAVASSSERSWVVDHLRTHDLLAAFDAIVCAEDVEHTKPFPDLYLNALRRLGLNAKEAIAFEDSEHGVAAAKAAGLYCVAVPNRVTECLAFEQADLVVRSLADRDLQAYIHSAQASASPR